MSVVLNSCNAEFVIGIICAFCIISQNWAEAGTWNPSLWITMSQAPVYPSYAIPWLLMNCNSRSQNISNHCIELFWLSSLQGIDYDKSKYHTYKKAIISVDPSPSRPMSHCSSWNREKNSLVSVSFVYNSKAALTHWPLGYVVILLKVWSPNICYGFSSRW